MRRLMVLFGLICGGVQADWIRSYDMERALHDAALVAAVEVVKVEEVPVTFGGKGRQTYYQFTFKPERVVKGVYSRDELVLMSSDFGLYGSAFDAEAMKPGQLRLLILGRSSVGYRNQFASTSMDHSFPLLKDGNDPMFAVAGVLLAHQEVSDRVENLRNVSAQLKITTGEPSLVLLAAIKRRAFLAAQLPEVRQAVIGGLNDEKTIVKEASAHVLQALLKEAYGDDKDWRASAATTFIEALGRPSLALNTRVALLHALSECPEEAVAVPDAVKLLSLDAASSTFAERAARVRVLSRIPGDHPLKRSAADYLTSLPLDANRALQQHAMEALSIPDAIFERVTRKKILGLNAEPELRALARLFDASSDAESVQHRVLKHDLNDYEKRIFFESCEGHATDALLPAITSVLRSRSKTARHQAIELLLEIDSSEAAKILRPYLKEELDLKRKLELAAYLGRHGMDDGYVYAIEHMSEPYVREEAIEALAAIGKPGLDKTLFEMYTTSHDIQWKTAAILAQSRIGRRLTGWGLIGFSADLKHPLAPAAIRALGESGIAITSLPALLTSRDPAIASAAARAAGALLAQKTDGIDRAEVLESLRGLACDAGAGREPRKQALDALIRAADSKIGETLIMMLRDRKLENHSLLDPVRREMKKRNIAFRS